MHGIDEKQAHSMTYSRSVSTPIKNIRTYRLISSEVKGDTVLHNIMHFTLPAIYQNLYPASILNKLNVMLHCYNNTQD